MMEGMTMEDSRSWDEIRDEHIRREMAEMDRPRGPDVDSRVGDNVMSDEELGELMLRLRARMVKSMLTARRKAAVIACLCVATAAAWGHAALRDGSVVFLAAAVLAAVAAVLSVRLLFRVCGDINAARRVLEEIKAARRVGMGK